MASEKQRKSDCKKICEELDLGFSLEKSSGAGVPTRKDVLRHLCHFIGTVKVGRKTSEEDAAELVMPSIKARWKGSNIEIAPDQTLKRRILAIYKLFK